MKKLVFMLALLAAAPAMARDGDPIAPIDVGQGRTLIFTPDGETSREPIYKLGIRYQGHDEPLLVDQLGADDKAVPMPDTATNFFSEDQLHYVAKERALTIDSEVGAGDWVKQRYTLISTPAGKGMTHRLRLDEYDYGEWDGNTGGTKNDHHWKRR